MPTIIMDGRGFPVQPKDINVSEHFFNAFDNMETEVSAHWIVSFLQERGVGWEPFIYDEIDMFYSRKFKSGFRFNCLISGGWIILGADKKYYVTDEFVYRCYKSSPVKKLNP